MTSKDIYQIVKSRSSEKEINSIITKFQEKKENSLLVYKNINKWQTSTCHGYIIQPSRQRIKKTFTEVLVHLKNGLNLQKNYFKRNLSLHRDLIKSRLQ